MSLTPPAANLRFAGIIAMLCRMVAARIAGGRLAGPLIILICRRLRRLARRFSALAARHAAGRLRPARRRPVRPRRPGTPRPQRPAAPSPLPRGRAWLIRLVPEAAAGASQLQYLLAEPEMAAFLAAAPQAGRILRPLCHMLGLRPPAVLTLPRRPARRRLQPRSAAEPCRAAGARPSSAAVSPAAAPAHRDAAPRPPDVPHACGPPGRRA